MTFATPEPALIPFPQKVEGRPGKFNLKGTIYLSYDISPDALMKRIRLHHREVIVWRHGQQVEEDHTSITQLWSSRGSPKEGHRYIDSRLNYLNHLDSFYRYFADFEDRLVMHRDLYFKGKPFPQQGHWHKTNPREWVNCREIEPPVWNHPGLPVNSGEIPFSDENYFFREPVRINLNKGWNRVLLKIPQDGSSWKWMFTFIPVSADNGGIGEEKKLKFSW